MTIAETIEKHGWAVQGVFPTEDVIPEERFPFAYSIGLIQRGCAHEIVIVGLPLEVCQGLINEIAEFTLANSGIPPSEWDIEGGYVLKPVFATSANSAVSVNVARAYYRLRKIGIVQYVWPSNDFKYPWDQDWPQNVLQPVGGQGRPIGS